MTPGVSEFAEPPFYVRVFFCGRGGVSCFFKHQSLGIPSNLLIISGVGRRSLHDALARRGSLLLRRQRGVLAHVGQELV